MGPTVAHTALRDFAAECYRAMGVPPTQAALVADSLVQADLWGHQSHGVMRLFWYAARLRSGAMAAETVPILDDGAGAIAAMDGGGGMGQVVAEAAMRHAIDLAQSHGIGAVAVRNSGHFGTAMYFTRMAAEAGCIGFLSTNASPAMAPWGGQDKRVGTNPWSWAAPAGRHPPMMLDISNTAVARGKLYLAKQRGEAIPDSWAMAPDGAATTDPTAGIAGTILPMAGHKGFGISVIMDVLSGVLSGSRFGASVVGPYLAEGTSGVGHLALVINIAATRPLQEFSRDMEQLIEELKTTPRRPGVEELFYPGEPEAQSDAALRKTGLTLPEATAEELRVQARDIGVEAPF